MKCAICGTEFAPNPNSKRKPKYCSPACKQRAYKLRKNIGAKPITKKTITPKQALADDFGCSGGDIPLNRHEFNRRMEREMDEPLETTLRRSKAKLQQVIDDPDTAPNCIAPLTKALIEVSEKLEAITGASDTMPDLLADDDEESEMIDDGLGAQII